MLVLRGPQVTKGQLPLTRLLQQRNKLPVVHEGHVDRVLPDLPKRKKAGSEPKTKRITTRATRFDANWRKEIALKGDF